MKKNKFLLFTISLLCFFGFKLNTKAYTSKINNYLTFTNYTTDFIVENYKVNDFYSSFLQYYNTVKNSYPYYLIVVKANNQTNYVTLQYYLFNNNPSLTLKNYYISSDRLLVQRIYNEYGTVFNFVEQSFTIPMNYQGSYNFNAHTQSSQSSTNWGYDRIQMWTSSGYNVSNGLYTYRWQSGTYPTYFIYDCNFDMYKTNHATNENMDLKIDNDYYVAGDIIPTYYQYFVNLTPTLSVTNLTPTKDNLNNIIKYTVDVSFSVFDTDNYKYKYCLDNVCNDFLENNSTLELYQNGSYVFQILDNNDELIDSYSLTISNINIETPFIDYSLSISPSCVAFIDNQSRNVCKTLKMKQGTSNPNYFYQYSVNNLDFENFYGSYSINLVQGDSVILRVIDSSNNVIWTSSFTINDLYTIDSTLGIFATFNLTSFGKSDYNSNYVEIYLYNLDLNFIDNVYISYNGYNFELLDVSNRGGYFFGITKDITKNQQIYLNVKNNNNEIIYSTSYYVDLTSSSKPSLLSFLENFNLSMSGPISNLVTAPIRLISNLTDYYGTCTPLILPSSIGNLSLPCMSEVYSSISNDLYNIIRLIFDGIICYYCSLNIIHTFKNLISPTDDRIEVINL